MLKKERDKSKMLNKLDLKPGARVKQHILVPLVQYSGKLWVIPVKSQVSKQTVFQVVTFECKFLNDSRVK